MALLEVQQVSKRFGGVRALDDVTLDVEAGQLVARPRVLLLDEPTAGLSPAETASVVGLVRRLPREVTILLIENDMDLALELAEQVTVLHYGRVVADGPTEAVRRDPRVTEIYLGTSDA